MPFEFKTDQGVSIAVLANLFDQAQGQEFASQLQREIPRGGRLIVDGSNLKTLTQQGVLHLMAAQRWTSAPERKRLPLVGFSSTVWRAIVENGSDFFFDSKSTLAEALQIFSLTAGSATSGSPSALSDAVIPTKSAASLWPTSAATSSPQKPAPVTPILAPLPPLAPEANSPVRTSSRSMPKADPWLQPIASVPPPVSLVPPSIPLSPPPPPPYVPPVRSSRPIITSPGPSRNPLMWVAVAALLAVGGLAAWWLLGNRAPVLTLSAPVTSVEEDGTDADPVTVEVQNGHLVESSWLNHLPDGLYFESPTDGSGSHAYTLRGNAKLGTTTTTLQLEAVNDRGQHTTPVPFIVNVKEKPMSWQLNTLQSLHLKVGQRIWTTSKFLVNADAVTVKAGLPPGLIVERIPGKNRDWQLTGTPTTAGNYSMVLAGTSPSGKQGEQTCTLEVAAEIAERPRPASPATPEPEDSATFTRAMVVTSNLDDKMRNFLLERIEKLPASTYSDEYKEKLRTVVGTLEQARFITQVIFERNGQTEISADQSTNLKAALQADENAGLLRDPACQVVIVGFASRTGSLAANVKISKLRARSVNDVFKRVVGHNADLCGDYGPTDALDQVNSDKNRAVEVYAGILKPSSDLQANAERFKQDYNRNHGLH